MSSSSTDDVYVDEPWLLMRWDSEHQCVFAEWKAFATISEFQGALMEALEAGRTRPGFNFVNDTRKLELISDEDQRWIQYTWTPLALVVLHSRTGKFPTDPAQLTRSVVGSDSLARFP